MDLPTLKHKLLQGSLAGMLRVGLAIPFYLVLTPYILDRLGVEMFGLWAFSTLVMSVMTLSDFGFKSALIYHIARDVRQEVRVREYFSVVFYTYVVMTLLVLFATLLLGRPIVEMALRVPDHLVAEAHFVLWITAAGFGLRFIGIAFQALLEAHQEHARVQFLLLGWLVCNFAATLLALWLKPDIYALGLAGFIANLVLLMGFWCSALSKYTHISLNWRHLRRAVFKDMLGYGSGIQVSTLLIACREPVIKVALARSFDLISVATFELVYKLCTQLASIVITPLLGNFSAAALLAEQRIDELVAVLRPMFAFCVSVFVPMAVLLAGFSPDLIDAWLGPGYESVSAILPWVFAGFAVYYTTEILYKTLVASGMSLYSALVQGISVGCSIAALFWFQEDNGSAIIGAILAGFASFSIVNIAVFRWRFPTIRLFTLRQASGLLVPMVVYMVVAGFVADHWLWLVFGGYLILHAIAVRMCGLFDIISVARKLAVVAGVRP